MVIHRSPSQLEDPPVWRVFLTSRKTHPFSPLAIPPSPSPSQTRDTQPKAPKVSGLNRAKQSAKRERRREERETMRRRQLILTVFFLCTRRVFELCRRNKQGESSTSKAGLNVNGWFSVERRKEQRSSSHPTL